MANENLPMPEGLTREKQNAQDDAALSKAADATRRLIANLRISQFDNADVQKKLDSVAVQLEKAQRAKDASDRELVRTLADIRKNSKEGKGEANVNKYLRDYDKTYKESVDALISAINDANKELGGIVKDENNKMSDDRRHEFRKQFAALEKMVDINESDSKKMSNALEEHEKNIEEMHKRWKKEDKDEKEKAVLLSAIKGNLKGALSKKYGVESEDGGKWLFTTRNAMIAQVLTPFRSIIDPLATILTKGQSKGLYEALNGRSDKKIKRNLETQEEDKRYKKTLEKIGEKDKEDVDYAELLGINDSKASLESVRNGYGRSMASELL